MRYLCAMILAGLAGCASQSPEQTESNTYSRYHKLNIDNPEAQVWIDSRFELLLDREIEGGKMWLYTDYKGQADQEFVMVLAGAFEKAEWPPETNEKLVSAKTPIGPGYESWGPIEAQDLGIQQLGAAHDFPVPPCGLARVLQHKSESGHYLSTVYTEGARCAVVFSLQDWGETMVRDRGRVIVRIKDR